MVVQLFALKVKEMSVYHVIDYLPLSETSFKDKGKVIAITACSFTVLLKASVDEFKYLVLISHMIPISTALRSR